MGGKSLKTICALAAALFVTGCAQRQYQPPYERMIQHYESPIPWLYPAKEPVRHQDPDPFYGKQPAVEVFRVSF